MPHRADARGMMLGPRRVALSETAGPSPSRYGHPSTLSSVPCGGAQPQNVQGRVSLCLHVPASRSIPVSFIPILFPGWWWLSDDALGRPLGRSPRWRRPAMGDRVQPRRQPLAAPTAPCTPWGDRGAPRHILGPARAPASPRGCTASSRWMPAPALLCPGHTGLWRSPPHTKGQRNCWRVAGASAGSGVINRKGGEEAVALGVPLSSGGTARLAPLSSPAAGAGEGGGGAGAGTHGGLR